MAQPYLTLTGKLALEPVPYQSQSRPEGSLPDCRNGGPEEGNNMASCWFHLFPEFTPSPFSSKASPAPPTYTQPNDGGHLLSFRP